MSVLKAAADGYGSQREPGRPRAARPEDIAPGQRTPPRRVVAGVDGSPNSVAALRRAVAQAGLRHAELEVVCVIAEDAGAHTAASALTMLRDTLVAVSPDGVGVPSRLRVERGEPALALVAVCGDAELLVIGARANSRRGNMFGGRTVPRCLDYARCRVDVCADHGEP